MENSLIHLSSGWERYSGQELSAVATNHIFKVDAGNYNPAIDYTSVLSAPELAKSARYFKQADRENYVLRKYALRQLLGKFLHQHPADIQFHQQANKKPAVPNLQFNTSHTKNGIAIAISQSPIGIDIEYIDPDFDYTDILHHSFSTAELKFVKNGTNPRLNFYTIWTRKEALLKASGQGIIDDLSQVDTLGTSFQWKNEIFNSKSLQTGNHIITTATTPNPIKFKLWEYAHC